MTYELAIGDRTYSSWSLRGWLLFKKFDIPVNVHHARMKSEEFSKMLEDFAPARLVPAMKTPEGDVIHDTLAMAETLNERHPDKQMWPVGPAARAMARSMVAEMHSGFAALREDCTMNLRRSYMGFVPSDAVRADVARLAEIWARARAEFGGAGPWLFGEYSIADVFFAPVSTRFATYNLAVNETALFYNAAQLADRALRQWRAMGLTDTYIQPGYDRDLEEVDWPGKNPIVASTAKNGPSENETCPYSGDPVTHFMEFDERIFGFCNAFCRDKTIADPFAWPEFVKIYDN